MKKLLVATAIASSLMLGGCATTAEQLDPNRVTMSKKLHSIKRGVVLMAEAVKAEKGQLNKGATTAGAGLIASGAVYGGYGGNRDAAAMAVAGLATMIFAGIDAATEVDAVRYTLQLTNGEMFEVIQVDKAPKPENMAILLKNYTDGSAFIFEDKTQGKTYTKSKSTTWADGSQAKSREEKARADLDQYTDNIKRAQQAVLKSMEVKADKTGETIDARNKALLNVSEGIKAAGEK